MWAKQVPVAVFLLCVYVPVCLCVCMCVCVCIGGGGGEGYARPVFLTAANLRSAIFQVAQRFSVGTLRSAQLFVVGVFVFETPSGSSP